MIVKMTILRLLGSSDEKKKIGVARPEGPPLRFFRYAMVLPTTIGCTDAHASVLPVLLISVELVQFSVSLSSFFVFCFA